MWDITCHRCSENVKRRFADMLCGPLKWISREQRLMRHSLLTHDDRRWSGFALRRTFSCALGSRSVILDTSSTCGLSRPFLELSLLPPSGNPAIGLLLCRMELTRTLQIL